MTRSRRTSPVSRGAEHLYLCATLRFACQLRPHRSLNPPGAFVFCYLGRRPSSVEEPVLPSPWPERPFSLTNVQPRDPEHGGWACSLWLLPGPSAGPASSLVGRRVLAHLCVTLEHCTCTEFSLCRTIAFPEGRKLSLGAQWKEILLIVYSSPLTVVSSTRKSRPVAG